MDSDCRVATPSVQRIAVGRYPGKNARDRAVSMHTPTSLAINPMANSRTLADHSLMLSAINGLSARLATGVTQHLEEELAFEETVRLPIILDPNPMSGPPSFGFAIQRGAGSLQNLCMQELVCPPIHLSAVAHCNESLHAGTGSPTKSASKLSRCALRLTLCTASRTRFRTSSILLYTRPARRPMVKCPWLPLIRFAGPVLPLARPGIAACHPPTDQRIAPVIGAHTTAYCGSARNGDLVSLRLAEEHARRRTLCTNLEVAQDF